MSNKNIHLKLKIISYKVGYIFNKNYAKDLNGGCDDTHTHAHTHMKYVLFVIFWDIYNSTTKLYQN